MHKPLLQSNTITRAHFEIGTVINTTRNDVHNIPMVNNALSEIVVAGVGAPTVEAVTVTVQ